MPNHSENLVPCPVCGSQPKTFSTTISHKNVQAQVWVTECEEMDDGDSCVEHRISVYGGNEEQSQVRWQNIIGKKNYHLDKI